MGSLLSLGNSPTLNSVIFKAGVTICSSKSQYKLRIRVSSWSETVLQYHLRSAATHVRTRAGHSDASMTVSPKPLSLPATGQGYPGFGATSCPCVSSLCERQCGTQGQRMLVESPMPPNPGCTVQPLLPSVSELLFSICEKETASLIG